MDDVLPARVRPASFAYLLPFVLVGAVVLGRFGPLDLGWLVNAALMSLPVLFSLVWAARGASPVRAAMWAALACALVLTSQWLLRERDSGLSLPFVFSLSLVLGAALAAFGALVAWPLVWRVRGARRDGLRRNVAGECALLALYGTLVAAVVCYRASWGPRLDDARWSVRALGAAIALAAVVGFAWELRLRLRVRSILAGQVPGWRAVELPAGSPREAPMLYWLDGFGWLRGSMEERLGESRAVVRTHADTADVYRGATQAAAPYALVPPRVPRVGLRALVCVACLVALAWMTDAAREAHAARDAPRLPPPDAAVGP